MPVFAKLFAEFSKLVTCPVLFVSGGPTGYSVPDEAERLAAFRDLEKVTLADAGHMMHWTRPAELAALTAFVLSLLLGNFTIRKLLSLKLGQPVRSADEVNKLYELHGKKAGTPTMGGILLLGSTVVATILWARPDNSFVWLVLGAMVVAGALGFADDYLKVSKKNSAGVRERTKLIVQCGIAIGVTWFFLSDPQLNVQARALFVPFADLTTKNETYSAGRYLDIEPTATGLYTIDFNYAYNPTCAYNKSYECPYPPPSNRLKVPIRAGEKAPPGEKAPST
jgi:hypothetical protein